MLCTTNNEYFSFVGLYRYPSAENLINFKIHRAKTRRVIKTSKKTSTTSVNLSPPPSRKKYGT